MAGGAISHDLAHFAQHIQRVLADRGQCRQLIEVNRAGFTGGSKPDKDDGYDKDQNGKSQRPPEVRTRAVRMVFEHQGSYETQAGAIAAIAPKIGCIAQTLRGWVMQAEKDSGLRYDREGVQNSVSQC